MFSPLLCDDVENASELGSHLGRLRIMRISMKLYCRSICRPERPRQRPTKEKCSQTRIRTSLLTGVGQEPEQIWCGKPGLGSDVVALYVATRD